jgi:hypothetical protein
LAEHRHEGLREGAFGKQAAQQVGQLEGDKEGVGEHAGPESARDHEVADKTEDARQQGHAADGGESLQEVHAGSGGAASAKPVILADALFLHRVRRLVRQDGTVSPQRL